MPKKEGTTTWSPPTESLLVEGGGVDMQGVPQLRKGLLFLLVAVVFLVALVTHWRPVGGPPPFTATYDPRFNEITGPESNAGEIDVFTSVDQGYRDFTSQQDNSDLTDFKTPQIAQPKPEVTSVGEKIEPIITTPDPDDVYKNVNSIWTYRCDVSKGCIRDLLGENEKPVEPEVCWLNCGKYGALWPYPVGMVKLGQCLTKFSANSIHLIQASIPGEESKASLILNEMWEIFRKMLGKLQTISFPQSDLTELENDVNVNIFVSENSHKINLDTDESFNIHITSSPADCDSEERVQVSVQINATNIFGARHGLETLLQLIAFDKYQKSFQIVNEVEIDDRPTFPYRGILIDTARNFLPVADLKRLIDGMAHNKLNVLHIHFTDSNSFPFYSQRVPKMSLYGAYSQEKIYYPNAIKDLVSYGISRGVKVLPELDAPAHAGNGWQWGPSEDLGDLAVCINKLPWRQYCGQPNCGQLNPINPNTFEVLEKLYQDFLDVFDNDLFHMGGDEVNANCWESELKWNQDDDKFDFISTWGKFQQEALVRLTRANHDKPLKAIVWTSGLTARSNGRKFLNPSSYIIQVWDGNRQLVRDLLHENYQLIMSNIESSYLDQGAGTWLGQEHVYTYRLWQKFYDNRLPSFMVNFSEDVAKKPSQRQMLGGESTLWSEKVNSQNMDSKTWPRGAAMGENLWSNPDSRSPLVYSRLNHHNRRLITLGIHSDQLQPESCYLLQGHCDDPHNPI